MTMEPRFPWAKSAPPSDPDKQQTMGPFVDSSLFDDDDPKRAIRRKVDCANLELLMPGWPRLDRIARQTLLAQSRCTQSY
ncbi:MAG: hypothetical protein PHS79_04015 [Patescibacteria group bacterium]|nr:hypothetical protein [Patescibacteria group bacterium]